jgi:hypothetical protein
VSLKLIVAALLELLAVLVLLAETDGDAPLTMYKRLLVGAYGAALAACVLLV